MRYFNLTHPIAGITLACMLTLAAQTPLSASEPGEGLEHSAIQEVLAMAEAGVDEEIILLRLEAIPAVPELSGQDIATLKQQGVSKSVLLRLVKRGQKLETVHAPPPTRSVPAVAAKADRPVAAKADRTVAAKADRGVAAKAHPDATPRIQINIQARFPIHYAEALIDDRRVVTQGELLDGESEPGFFLTRPRNLLRSGSVMLLDESVEPGTYRVAVGVAHTEVLSDPNDEWSEYSRQSYGTSVVPAAVMEPECEVASGEVCVVTARISRSRRARPGSAEGYAVEFDTRVVPAQP